MKKHLNLWMIAIVTLSMAFFACDKEPKEEPRDEPRGETKGYSIVAKNVLLGSDQIATAKALAEIYDSDGVEEAIATSNYKNSGFELKPPKVLADKFLYCFADEFEYEGSGIIVSDLQAKTAGIRLAAFDKNDMEIGEFYYGIVSDIYANSLAVTSYTYADRHFSIKGKLVGEDEYFNFTVEYNCSFKKGWNEVYTVVEINENQLSAIVTTTKPKEIPFVWYFMEDGEWAKKFDLIKKFKIK